METTHTRTAERRKPLTRVMTSPPHCKYIVLEPEADQEARPTFCPNVAGWQLQHLGEHWLPVLTGVDGFWCKFHGDILAKAMSHMLTPAAINRVLAALLDAEHPAMVVDPPPGAPAFLREAFQPRRSHA
ncbi:hypothetical protein LCGC14_1200500 [marine sediment metagenome]|uniref:Uncharacterized protein n=1 Tax=marine sediment metagenome TaxID=412755 RepID=A0A0F9M4E5_9ZZZZ